jgi:hypothetical protein
LQVSVEAAEKPAAAAEALPHAARVAALLTTVAAAAAEVLSLRLVPTEPGAEGEAADPQAALVAAGEILPLPVFPGFITVLQDGATFLYFPWQICPHVLKHAISTHVPPPSDEDRNNWKQTGCDWFY